MANLTNYSEADQALLRRAAEHHADKIETAALNSLHDGWVNGFDIRELEPFVVARRAELFGAPPCPSGYDCRKYDIDAACACSPKSLAEPQPEERVEPPVAPVEPTPQPVIPVPEPEKEPEEPARCQAKTASGSQCKLPAVAGITACKLPAHVKQLG